ncbi:MAG TPA: efflux RND transporter permease subunit [Chitinophagaceae bacterium]|nr:efflux RND transporter permease subunit [Chitinophagaceae bacterium]
MSLPSISLKRPVLAIVMSIIIVIFGIVGFTFLGVRDYPAIDPPVISVRTSYTGANADIMESQVTEPLEKAINGIAGIKSISSNSAQGTSNITVEFDLNTDLEAAANDVRDKVSQAQRSLPDDLDAPPVVSKADANASPIVVMTLQSSTRNPMQITDYAENVLQERLQTIPGVSSIQIWGEKLYSMRLWLDPLKMAAYKLTPQDVQTALAQQNVELPSGKLTGDATELTIRTFGRLFTPQEFDNLIIKNIDGKIIHLSDIGHAQLGPQNPETNLKEQGVPMVGLAIIPLPGSNYVAISDEFYKRLGQIQKDLPKDLKIDIIIDDSRYIKSSISEVEETLAIALALVILIIYFFFRDWIIAIRPLFDIPVSLIGAFFIMYLCGFSINILTLLGIVLATGLVVDDGIVVTENIFKKLEAGMPKMQACREGSEEIFFAVIATSITLAFVFLPIIFLQGFVGRLFREFGIVIAGAVLLSAFVSLTLTPVLNLKMARDVHHRSWFYRRTEPFFRWMEDGYKNSLKRFMTVRWVGLLIIAICLAMIYLIGSNLKSELAPLEDRSQFRVSMTAPEGTSYTSMDKYMDKEINFLEDSVPERDVVLSVTSPGFGGNGGANTGFMHVTLKPPGQRHRSQQQVVNYFNSHQQFFTEGRAYATQTPTIKMGRHSGLPVEFVIQNINFDSVEKVLPVFMKKVREDPTFQVVDVDLKFNKPELRVTINRSKASQLGVSIADISQTLQLALSNVRYGYFTRNGKQYDVIGELLWNYRDAPYDLKDLYVRNNQGQSISLDNLVNVQMSTSPPKIYHYNRYKSATISASLSPGKTQGEGIAEMRKIANQTLGPSFTTALSGSARDFAESSSNTSFAFILALVLIYLILAAQFESWVDPFIIMLTVPLAIAGAVLCLWLFDQTLNIFSEIGMIMLIGLVTKNGILIVEFANKKRDSGMSRVRSVVDAASLRLRPILMTSLAMSLGALPIALSLGAASTSRIPLGIVIVGGILFALVLTLFVIPAMYSFLSRRKPVEYDERPVTTEMDTITSHAL